MRALVLCWWVCGWHVDEECLGGAREIGGVDVGLERRARFSQLSSIGYGYYIRLVWHSDRAFGHHRIVHVCACV